MARLVSMVLFGDQNGCQTRTVSLLKDAEMDLDHLGTWEQMRTTFAGPHRQLAIPALIAATLFCNVTKTPANGSNARKVSNSCKKNWLRQNGSAARDRLGLTMHIKRHDKSYLVELDDGSEWRIWPADIALTLQWLPATELDILEIEDELVSHVLVDQSDGLRVRVVEAQASWPAEKVQHCLEHG
jgi:hypothetical protein